MRISISKGTAGDVDRIMEIMETAGREISEPDWYVMDDRDYVCRHTEKEGFILKAEEEGKILAFLIVHMPGSGKENLGHYLKLEEKELEKAAHMDSVSVLPKARGKGLMGQLMEEAEKLLEQMGFHYLMGTVHPDNCFSHGNFQKLGYRDVAAVKKYGGLPRIVVCKHI